VVLVAMLMNMLASMTATALATNGRTDTGIRQRRLPAGQHCYRLWQGGVT
jgi:hypothetical protein